MVQKILSFGKVCPCWNSPWQTVTLICSANSCHLTALPSLSNPGLYSFYTSCNRILGLSNLGFTLPSKIRSTYATAGHVCRGFTSQSRPSFSPQEEQHLSILERLHSLENKVRIYGYSTIRWGLGLVFLLGVGVYIFRESLRENVADEVAGVASRSLGKLEPQKFRSSSGLKVFGVNMENVFIHCA